MLMPKEFEIRTPLDDMSDAELADLIAAVQSLIAGSAALAPAGGERTGVKAALGFVRYRPYPKQAAFHAAGAIHRERLLMAGNQLGQDVLAALRRLRST